MRDRSGSLVDGAMSFVNLRYSVRHFCETSIRPLAGDPPGAASFAGDGIAGLHAVNFTQLISEAAIY